MRMKLVLLESIHWRLQNRYKFEAIMGIGLHRIRNENCLKTMAEKIEFRGKQ